MATHIRPFNKSLFINQLVSNELIILLLHLNEGLLFHSPSTCFRCIISQHGCGALCASHPKVLGRDVKPREQFLSPHPWMQNPWGAWGQGGCGGITVVPPFLYSNHLQHGGLSTDPPHHSPTQAGVQEPWCPIKDQESWACARRKQLVVWDCSVGGEMRGWRRWEVVKLLQVRWEEVVAWSCAGPIQGHVFLSALYPLWQQSTAQKIKIACCINAFSLFPDTYESAACYCHMWTIFYVGGFYYVKVGKLYMSWWMWWPSGCPFLCWRELYGACSFPVTRSAQLDSCRSWYSWTVIMALGDLVGAAGFECQVGSLPVDCTELEDLCRKFQLAVLQEGARWWLETVWKDPQETEPISLLYQLVSSARWTLSLSLIFDCK